MCSGGMCAGYNAVSRLDCSFKESKRARIRVTSRLLTKPSVPRTLLTFDEGMERYERGGQSQREQVYVFGF